MKTYPRLLKSETVTESPLSLALIVPYRDRLEHLMAFVPHMEAFIKDIKFHIMVVEQAGEQLFNRGKLLNIGFTLAHANWVCFHDVDLLPASDSCDYSFPKYTTHLAERREQHGYNLSYPEYLGGVLLTTSADFEKVNGFSNEYWGWGHEDNDLFVRFLLAGVKIDRKPGFYKSLPHKRALLSVENGERFLRSLLFAAELVNDPIVMDRIKWATDFCERSRKRLAPGWHPPANEAKDYRSDGLSTLTYDLLSRRPLKEFIQFSREISDSHEIVTVKL